MLHRLIYRSRSRIAGSPKHIFAETAAVLSASREKNRQLEITGVLLFDGETFVQVLEGRQAAVEALYETIRQDPRHEDVLLLDSFPAARRDFTNWTMGYAYQDGFSLHYGPLIFEHCVVDPAGAAREVLDLLRVIFEPPHRRRTRTRLILRHHPHASSGSA